MRFLILLFICLITTSKTIAQDIVKMEKSSGVYFIPCKVNGLPLKFIFDTGASDVSISLTEALFMLKNGYLKESDIRGTVYYSIANGEIAEGTKINIQKIEVGKQILYNVEASIVHSIEAPLLFGQSAMERFGKFTMDYSNSNLIINRSSNSVSNSTNSSSIKSVKIGNQTWMTENLNVDRFRNGDLIPEAKTNQDWENAGYNEKPVWCYYNFNSKFGEKYGKLYNWYAVNDPRGLAPEGWHIPSKNDWEFLNNFLGGNRNSAIKLKSKTGWPSTKFKGTNSTGFSAIPGGSCNIKGDGGDIELSCFFWTSSYGGFERIETVNFTNWIKEEGFYFHSKDKMYGLSVRCIKD